MGFKLISSSLLVLVAGMMMADPLEPALRWSFKDGQCAAVTADGRKIAGTVKGKVTSGRDFFDEPSLSLLPGGTTLPLAEDYFDVNQGTVIFWLKPLNWGSDLKPADGVKKDLPLNIVPLFGIGSIEGNNWSLLSYLVHNPVSGAITLDFRSLCREPEMRTIYTQQRIKNMTLKSGEWHNIAFSWSSMELKLYIDGKLICEASYGLPISKKYDPAWLLQLMPESWWGWKHDFHTAIGGAVLYNQTLNNDQISELYGVGTLNRQAGSVAIVTAPELSIPVDLDGRITETEWRDASRIPLMRVNDTGMLDMTKPGWVMIKHDRNHLYISCRSEGKPRISGLPGQADPEVYKGSIFEIAGRLPDAANALECFQVAIGPNGAFTSRRADGGAEPVKFEAKSFMPEDRNYWECEIAIPLKEIGFTAPGKYDMQFILHRPENNDAARNWILWSLKKPLKMYFDGMGTVTLGSGSKAWRIESLKEPAGGIFNPEFSGSGMTSRVTGSDGRPVTGPLTPGSYKLKITDGKGNFEFESGFVIRNALYSSMKIHAAANRLELAVDAQGMYTPGETLTAEAELTDSNGRVIEKRKTEFNAPKGILELSLADLAGDVYNVNLRVTGSNGKSFTQKHSFKRPSDIFLRDRKGLENIIYPPWRPLDKNGDRVSTPFITYTFDKGAFPTLVTAYGIEVLNVAPKLVATVAGQEYTFTPLENSNNSETPEEFVSSGVMCAGPLKLDWRRKLHYDGMIRYDLVLKSVDSSPVTIERLIWRMNVPAAVARYSLSPIYNHEWTTRGSVDVFPNVWLTNNRAGITVFTDNDANWVYAPGTKPMKLRRSASGDATVTLRMIESPVTLSDRPAKYVLGFGATPTKPPRRDWRKLHADGWGRIKGQNIQIVGWAGMEHWTFKRNSDLSQPLDDGFRYWRKTMAERPASVQRIFPYGYLAAMPDENPVFDYYGRDWGFTVKGFVPPRFERQIDPNDNKYFYFGNPVCRNHPDYADFVAYYVDEFMGKFKFVPGPYFDGGQVEETDRPYRDTDLTDVFNPQRKVFNNNIFGLRDICERLYKITRKHRGDAGLVYFHSWQDYRPAVASFLDIIYPGEEFMHTIMQGLQVYVDAPPEQWQANYSSAIYGAAVQFLPQYRNYGGSLIDLAPETRRQYTKPLLMMGLIHDVPISGGFYPDLEKAWAILDTNLTADAEFHGYWEQKELTITEPGVKVSFYRNPNHPELLVMLGNTGRSALTVSLDSGKRQYKAIDMENGKEVDLKQLSIEDWGFRILKLTPEH